MTEAARTTRRGFLALRFGTAKASTSPSSRPAAIVEHLCLAHQGSFCSVCRERCPEPGAIVVARGKPTIDATRCTGCGICADVCPAPFGGAIAVLRTRRSQR